VDLPEQLMMLLILPSSLFVDRYDKRGLPPQAQKLRRIFLGLRSESNRA
jgi:hypothetical protein